MKKLIVFLLFAGFSSYAQTDTLNATVAKNFIDKEVIVKGKIAGSRLFEKDNKKTFLINLDEKYPDSPLTVVLYDEIYTLSNIKGDIENKTIIASGIVTIFKDKPQIIIKKIENLRIY